MLRLIWNFFIAPATSGPSDLVAVIHEAESDKNLVLVRALLSVNRVFQMYVADNG